MATSRVRGGSAMSPLRAERKARNWTLEDVVEQCDLRAEGGHSGVTASMISGWELGKHTTSLGHRKTLCEIYGKPADVLFAHQDEGLSTGSSPELLARFPDLQRAMLDTVTSARECLVVMGSRSRDPGYLSAIEETLAERPALVFYRVMFGPPRHPVLVRHLSDLLRLRDPQDRSHGVKTLHLGIIDDEDVPERFFCASEGMAVVPIPSLTSHEAFDSGIRLGAPEAGRLLDHGRQAYAAARKVETVAAIEELSTMAERGTR
jgi:transcriptional regulator with XRE-family HTH domain